MRALVHLVAVLSACSGEPAPATVDVPATEVPEPVVEAAEPVLLDSYGDPLPSGATHRLGTARLRHRDEVTALAWAEGGDLLVSAGADGDVRAWDGRLGRRVARFADARGRVLAASPDGSLLAIADPGLVVVGAESGAVRWRHPGAPRVPDAVFSPDGTHLAFIADSGVEMVTSRTGERQYRREEHRAAIERIAFSPDGGLLASVDASGLVLVRETGIGSVQTTFVLPEGALPVRVLAFSPDGNLLAAGSDPIEIRNAATGEFLRELGGQGPAAYGEFAGDLLTVFHAGPPAAVIAWDAQTGERRILWRDVEARPVVAVALRPGGDRIAVADATGRISVLRSTDGTRMDDQVGHEGEVVAICFGSEPGVLWTAGNLGQVFRWDSEAGTARDLPQAHTGGATSLAPSPDGSRVLSGGWDGLVREWDVATWTLLRTLPAGAPAWVGWRGDGAPVTFSSERGLLAWPADGPVALAPPRTGVAATDPAGRRAVVPAKGGMVVVDLSDGTVLNTLTGLATPAANLQAAAFSPDGTAVAFASADSRAWIVELERDEPPRVLVGPPGVVTGIAWSPEGRRVVTAHSEGAWVWNAASGEPIEFLAGHDDFTTAADWSPDGLRIATASADGTALIWQAPPEPFGSPTQ